MISPKLRLANKVSELLFGATTFIETWGFYLKDKKFDDEPELRDRIFVIWFGALLDTIEAFKTRLPVLKAQALHLGYETMASSIDLVAQLGAESLSIAQMYSINEQVLLYDLRSQYVHGYFNNRHNDRVVLRVVSPTGINKLELDHAEYSRIVRIGYEAGLSLESLLTPLRERAFYTSTTYWPALNFFRLAREDIYRMLREDVPFVIPADYNV